MQLRFILLLVICGLLIITAGLVGGLGYSSSHRTLKNLTGQEFALGNEAAANQIGDFLSNPANHLLGELTLRAQRSMLPLTNDEALGLDLAERLRVDNHLAWISYSEAATGRFIGVWRAPDGQIVLNRSIPGPQQALERIVTPEGKLIPYIGKLSSDYDPRPYPWFQRAMASRETVWSKPYHFEEDIMGITASRSWRPYGAEQPVGVFTVDFYLHDLEQLLHALDLHTRAFFCVLDAQGEVIFSGEDPPHGPVTDALSGWVKAHPDFKDIDLDAGLEASGNLLTLTPGGEPYVIALYRVQKPSGLKFTVASSIQKSIIYDDVNRVRIKMIIVSVFALLLAAAIGWVLAFRISEPLRVLGNDLAQVGQFQLAPQGGSSSMVREVNQLRDAADRMKSGLRSFMKYVPDDLVRQVLSTGREAVLGGETRRMTLFFSDIEGFTTYSEKVTPAILVQELSRYFQILCQTLKSHSGTIDKFIGDGALAFFNAPLHVTHHEQQACHAALAALQQLQKAQNQNKLPAFRTRIGLHSGEVVVGNMGTSERFAYTVIGDAVNAASRLEGLNKIYGTQIIASHEVMEKAGDEFVWRHLDRVAVAGRKGPMEIYELLGLKTQLNAASFQHRDQYEKALQSYFRQAFAEAEAIFTQLTSDKAAQTMAARCRQMATQNLPPDWPGIYVFQEK